MRFVLAFVLFGACYSVFGSLPRWTSESGHPACHGTEKPFGAAGNFTIYVFQQTWAAGYCEHEQTTSCAAPTDFMRSNLVIHGVWPSFNELRDGHNGPQCCDSEFGPHITPATLAPQRPELDRNWPGLGTRPHRAFDANPRLRLHTAAHDLQFGMWQHEWMKHGTCSAKNPAHYFGTSLQMQRSLPTPNDLQSAIGSSIDKSKLLTLYQPPSADLAAVTHPAGKPFPLDWWTVAICFGGGRHSGELPKLMHLTTCWSHDEQRRVLCPDWVRVQNNCAADSIAVPKFTAASTV